MDDLRAFVFELLGPLMELARKEVILRKCVDAGCESADDLRSLRDEQLGALGFGVLHLRRLRDGQASSHIIHNHAPTLAQVFGKGRLRIESAVMFVLNYTAGGMHFGGEEEAQLREFCALLRENHFSREIPSLVAEDCLVTQEEHLRDGLNSLLKIPAVAFGDLRLIVGKTLELAEERVKQLSEGSTVWHLIAELKKRYAAFTLEDFDTGENSIADRAIDRSFISLRIAEWSKVAEVAAMKGDRRAVSEASELGMKECALDGLWSSDRKRVIVQGEAGAGKTTLLKRCAYEWAQRRIWTDVFDIVIFLRLRDIHKDKRGLGLEDVLVSALFQNDEKRRNDAAFLLSWLHRDPNRRSKKALWILDGWDEIGIPLANSALEAIKKGSDRHVEYVLLGSRPECVQYFVGLNSQLVIHGFTKNGVREFVRMYFSTHESGVQEMRKLLSFFEESDWMRDACRLPLMLRLVCLVSKMLEVHMRKTDVYKLVIDFIFQRLKERIESTGQKRTVDFDKRNFLPILRKLAWKGFLENELLVHESDLEQSFLSCGLLKAEGYVGTSKMFAWVHYTLQEFLAAEHVCLIDNSPPDLTQLRQQTGSRSDVFFGFFIGLGGLKTPVGKLFLSEYQLKSELRSVLAWDVEDQTLELHNRLKEQFGNADIEFVLRLLNIAVEEGFLDWVKFACSRYEAFTASALAPLCNDVGPAFLQACKKGHVLVVEFLVKHVGLKADGVEVGNEVGNGRDRRQRMHGLDGQTSFQYPIFAARDLATLQCLFNLGASLNIRNNTGDHVLLWVIAFSDEPEDCAMWLLRQQGINLAIRGARRRSPLHVACLRGNLELVKVFLSDSTVSVNEVEANGLSALHFAAWRHHTDIMQFLISHGADINLKDIHGAPPLFMAIGFSDFLVDCMVYMLMRNGAVDANGSCQMSVDDMSLWSVGHHRRVSQEHLLCVLQDTQLEFVFNGMPSLFVAIRLNLVDVVKLLLKRGSASSGTWKHGVNGLHYAVMQENLKLVSVIIESGSVDVMAKTDQGFTALLLACGCGNIGIVKAILACYEANMMLGAANARDESGHSPLFYACERKHQEVAICLLESIEEFIDTEKNEWLDVAAALDCAEVVRWLLLKVSFVTAFLQAVAKEATQEGRAEVLRVMLEKCSSQLDIPDLLLCASCSDGCSETMKVLLSFDVNLVSCPVLSDSLWTALHTSCYFGLVNVANVLLRHGADTEQRNKADETALICALKGFLHKRSPHSEENEFGARMENHVEVVQLLVDMGANLDARVSDIAVLDFGLACGKEMSVLLQSFMKMKLEPVCTRALSGTEFVVQAWFECETCNLTTNAGCCKGCALFCHEGHVLKEIVRLSSFFCDCPDRPERCKFCEL